ncbi:ESCRT-II complex subunit VPS25 [Intoshia linei]|uniref:Vacuolar protein-sorting-associated protein 25 n=1 Tax=Intoshia linei TaxID=1819745 RepID=A0A177AR62_9BILA|nr:ESCRT-II complex subunit VPS25 [Intoshia linei]
MDIENICKLYNFPPFFTLQVTENSKLIQLQMWTNLIIQYCRQNKLFKINFKSNSDSEFPLFNNPNINRTAGDNLISAIRKTMENSDRILKCDGKDFVLWNTITEWVDIFINWARETLPSGGIYTVHELLCDEKNKHLGKIN